MDYRQARRQQAEQVAALQKATARTGRQPSPIRLVWHVIWDELVALVFVLPALVGLVVLAWFQYPEEGFSYRVMFTLVVALLVPAFIAASIAALIFGI